MVLINQSGSDYVASRDVLCAQPTLRWLNQLGERAPVDGESLKWARDLIFPCGRSCLAYSRECSARFGLNQKLIVSEDLPKTELVPSTKIKILWVQLPLLVSEDNLILLELLSIKIIFGNCHYIERGFYFILSIYFSAFVTLWSVPGSRSLISSTPTDREPGTDSAVSFFDSGLSWRASFI